jgi:gamma-glutamyl hydrolase
MRMNSRTTGQVVIATLFIIQCGLAGSLAEVNNRPILGILAEDTHSPYGSTYIPVNYVKFLQQAGARVVPIRGNQSLDYYRTIVNFTNGALIPGGGVNFATSVIGRTAKIVYNLALELNKKGDYYPIWGTCMGFQLLCYLTEGVNLLKPTDTDNITWPLYFTPESKASRMFGSAPPEILRILATENVTQNQHQYSILTSDFESSTLSTFYQKLSTNKDRKGTEFISSIEAKDYPIYGVQWHPEKNNFNWNPNYTINHNANAVRVGQYMANFFVSEARKSGHKFPNVEAEAVNLIQNYKLVYFSDGSFSENYYLD